MNWIHAAVLLVGVSIGWAANGWRLGGQIAEIRAEQAEAAATIQAQARAKEQALTKQLQEAQHAAKTRETKLRADADAARKSAGGLRDELTAIRRSLPSLAADACRIRADTVAELFGACADEYGSLAAEADRIASERQTLIEAWPK